MHDPEIGRELRVDELMVKTVVIIGRADRNWVYTVWVYAIDDVCVTFLADEIKTLFCAERHTDGTLTDATGRRILMWEYLGVI
jgi:hypothetical protein